MDDGECKWDGSKPLRIPKSYSKEEEQVIQDLWENGGSTTRGMVISLLDSDIHFRMSQPFTWNNTEDWEALGGIPGTKIKWSMGAWWDSEDNEVVFDSKYYSWNSDDLGAALLHEVKHLQQGRFVALSVYGERKAWNLEYDVRVELGLNVPSTYQDIHNLPLSSDRATLLQARQYMMSYNNYRADLLPLIPLPWAIGWKKNYSESTR